MSETENLPATQQLSAADKERMKVQRLIQEVQTREDSLAVLLRESRIPFDRFVEVFRRALVANKDLVACDAASVIKGVMDACTAGVLPDGKKGALVPYNVNVARRGEPRRYVKKAQFLMMFEGMLEIAYASGNFRSIMAHVVYDGDDWEYELGLNPYIRHKPKPRPAKHPDAPDYTIIGAYAVAKTVNGGEFMEVFEPEDIRRVMAVSKATSGPTKDWPDQMARKGPLRRMWKFLPRDARMDRVLEVDNEAFSSDELEAQADPAPARKLRGGFAPPAPQAALTQGADIPMEMVRTDEDGVLVDENTEIEAKSELSAEPQREKQSRRLPDDDEPKQEAEQPGDTSSEALVRSLQAAVSWLNVKQALKTFDKTEDAQEGWKYIAARRLAWERMGELRAEKKDKTDFASDPLLFECWLHGADPDPGTVTANWEIVQQDRAYTKLDEAHRERISEAVAQALLPDEEPEREDAEGEPDDQS